jgi:hypothetical protein
MVETTLILRAQIDEVKDRIAKVEGQLAVYDSLPLAEQLVPQLVPSTANLIAAKQSTLTELHSRLNRLDTTVATPAGFVFEKDANVALILCVPTTNCVFVLKADGPELIWSAPARFNAQLPPCSGDSSLVLRNIVLSGLPVQNTCSSGDMVLFMRNESSAAWRALDSFWAENRKKLCGCLGRRELENPLYCLNGLQLWQPSGESRLCGFTAMVTFGT